MIIFDQLKKNDPQLRAVTVVVLAGLVVLLAGLWWVQIVSGRDYQANLENQSFRTVRIPAVRGKILDRNGAVLAENRPIYNVSVYLEELYQQFKAADSRLIVQAQQQLKRRADDLEHSLHRKLRKDERKQFRLTLQDKNILAQQARYDVASNVVVQIGKALQEPLSPDLVLTNFERHYQTRLALPFPVKTNLNSFEIARLEEQPIGVPGVDLEVESTRLYPYDTTAAHLLGFLGRDDSSREGEEAFFSFRLPDYRGVVGIEAGYDAQLRGTAGAKYVLVNNLGYRQAENVWSPAEPGNNVTLTIDLRIQQAAESALAVFGPTTHGAAVVMDVHTGDILAMASSPTLNPNYFIQHFPPGEWERITEQRAEINRATQENYQPGSIFKTVVAMALLESGLDPKRNFTFAPNPQEPDRAVIWVGQQRFRDTARPGDYNFRRALKLSSNCYFITNGLVAGVERIVDLGHRLHLGETNGLPTHQDAHGHFPSLNAIRRGWHDGDTANLCIGQGYIDVTPMQMAVMTAAIANGGHVLWPRLVDRISPQDPTSTEPTTIFPKGRVRDELGVRPSTLTTLREAMLADVEDVDGTGREAAVPGLRICGKTGTAQKKNIRGQLEEHITWFASFAPYEEPRYAVLVMVEFGTSGGTTCAPVAEKIYRALLEREREGAAKPETLALTH